MFIATSKCIEPGKYGRHIIYIASWKHFPILFHLLGTSIVLKRSKHVSSVQIIPKFEEVSFHLFFWSCYEHIPGIAAPQIDRIVRNLEIMEETSSRSYPGHAFQSFWGLQYYFVEFYHQ